MGEHQKPEVSKRKRHDAVFRVKPVRQKSRRGGEDTPNAPGASADPGSHCGEFSCGISIGI